ncbi:MAG TPA: heparan-alpha-glucosaminide N-acetyltransferase domain-containing protein [Phycisphaerae bacterium]|nr:heparan-alpha-glucosaminide N-acetyltransferase domain-containing protein [Phycisphaerae bacterium]
MLPVARKRLDSVDLLRGLIMAFMALDHVRDYLTNLRFQPEDLSRTTPALFATRWITHFCAPVFMFLVGAGMSLAQQGGKTKGQLARFLISRGLWLIFLEFTVVHIGWEFNLGYHNGVFLLVLWALGMCMICLAGLIYLSRSALAVFSLGMIAGHNLLDRLRPADFGSFAPLWTILHQQGPLGRSAFVLYPLIPWIGVMAAGYLFGPILRGESRVRRGRLIAIGLALTAAFVVIRWINQYGDRHPWSTQASPLFTFMSFLNTTKYPPSLLYLLMTLGPAIAFMGLVDQARGPVARFFITIGRVPFFYYLLHIYLIHLIAVAAGLYQGFDTKTMFAGFLEMPPNFGFGLPFIYVVWIAVVVILYFPCRWFAGVKSRHRENVWLSYL